MRSGRRSAHKHTSISDGSLNANTARQTPTENCSDKYTVVKIVRLIGMSINKKYLIRWRDYSAKKDTTKLLDRTLQLHTANDWYCRAESMKLWKQPAARSKYPRNQNARTSGSFCIRR